MQIPAWMITKEMKHTEHYRMYAKVFGIDVPLTQSQSIESTQGTHRTPSTPSHEEQEARENVALVDEHFASEEIEKMVSPGASNKWKVTDVEIAKIVRWRLLTVKERFMPRKSFDTLADNLHDVMVEDNPTMERGNIQAQILTQIENAIANVIFLKFDAYVTKLYVGNLLMFIRFLSQTSLFQIIQYQLYIAMKADPQLQQQDIVIWLALQMKFERNTVPQTACRTPIVRLRDQDDLMDGGLIP
ncbi:hypothetical protein Tco_0689660 [Tanacetum coccineum]